MDSADKEGGVGPVEDIGIQRVVPPALFVNTFDVGVVVAHLGAGDRARSPSKTTPPIGYYELSRRGQRSQKNVEWSMTASPGCGCMFCMEPAHGPCNMPRQSPKYRRVKESGPSGTGDAA